MGWFSFHSLTYIIALILCIAFYYMTPIKVRWIVLLIESMVFYSSIGWEKFLFAVVTSLILWFASKGMDHIYILAEKEAEEKQLTGKEKQVFFASYRKKCRNFILLPALITILGGLCWCKYAAMLFETCGHILGKEGITFKVLVPLGISYYTFSGIGYLLDVYWRKQKCIKNYFKFALCMFYFPQMVQGPIARYQKLLVQFERENSFQYKRVCFGIQLMLYGYIKKMILADRLALITTSVFGNIEEYEGLVFLFALIASSLQLYLDFSGCMDIVRGTSQIFGIELDKNFDHPFFSRNVAEFWRKWHITLGSWFKDYVYLPVATSPSLMKRTFRIKEQRGNVVAKAFSITVPLAVVWILTGIWHGTGMNYILWGCYYGGVIIVSTVCQEEYKKLAEWFRIPTKSAGWQKVQMIRTFGLFTLGRLLTVPGTLAASGKVLLQMGKTFNPWIFWDGTFYRMGLDFKDYMVLLLGLNIVWKVSRMQEKGSVRERIAKKPIVLRWAIYYAAIFAIFIFGMYGSGYDASAFIYAQF